MSRSPPAERRLRWSLPIRPSRAVPLLVPFLALAGCGLLDSDPERFSEPRLYAHDLFPSEQECLDAQPPDPFFINCQQWLALCPDGEARLVETDIVWPGSYRIARDRLTVELGGGRASFLVFADGEVLIRLKDGTEWILQDGEEDPRTGCGDS